MRLFSALFLLAIPALTSAPRFEPQTIAEGFGIGYAVITADVDGDENLDIVAINETQVVWFENPDWTPHVILDGKTEADNVALTAGDFDRDGAVDFAIGAAWRPSDTEGGGTLQWIRRKKDPRSPWRMFPIGAEPTLHRLRTGDVDGDGEAELIVAPLHGRSSSGPKWWEGRGVRLLVMRPGRKPKRANSWQTEYADFDNHLFHNFWLTPFDRDPALEIITASYEGITLLDRDQFGVWKRTRLGKGHEEGDGALGAGEVKLGTLSTGKRFLATVEPWHANHLAVYIEPGTPITEWPRRVVVDELGAGHALWPAELDGERGEELIVGWRGKGEGDFAKPGLAVFFPGRDWEYEVIDSGGMATEDATAADLDGDGRVDVIAAGRATSNVKIYWNRE